MATSGVDAVTLLDPWHEPGIPLEEQYRSWKQRIKAPYDKHEVDAYTRTTTNWLHPADQSVLETTIAYEQVAIDLTAYFARTSGTSWREPSCRPRSRRRPRERRRRPGRRVLPSGPPH